MRIKFKTKVAYLSKSKDCPFYIEKKIQKVARNHVERKCKGKSGVEEFQS